MLVALVRGVGDIGSAVAHRLFQAGHAVIIHDTQHPTTSRRKMAFADAVFDGRALLDGIAAMRVDDLNALAELIAAHEVIPVVVTDLHALLRAVHPDVLVDAQMRKRAQPEMQRGLARLTIGLGPGFVAGETTDLAVETSWGADLGKVLDRGGTRLLAGEPRPIAGHARDRYVYAPVDGIFHTTLQIGDAVRSGQVIARIGATALTAPIDGVLRGLTQAGVVVSAGTKVIEVDPRGSTAITAGIGERPGRIADGVLRAVQGWAKTMSARRESWAVPRSEV